MKYIYPGSAAKNLIKKFCLKDPSDLLDLTGIAAAENLFIFSENSRNYLGRIVYNDNHGIIKVSSSITNEEKKRFVIAHEMGHFYLDKNACVICNRNDFKSYNSSTKNEKSANKFASSLLIYKDWFLDLIQGKEIGKELINEVSSFFGVSFTAAAIRFVELRKKPFCILHSTGLQIKWAQFNYSFPHKYIYFNSYLPLNTRAANYFLYGEIDESIIEINSKVWFESSFYDHVDLFEQNIFMPNYNSVLTLLWEED